MSRHFGCPNCAAPLVVQDALAALMHCGFCGTTSPIPQDVLSDPQWQWARRRHELEQWYHATRKQYMTVDTHGNLQPPTKDSMAGMMLGMGGMILAFGTSAFCFIVGIAFPPLWFLLPFTFFGIFFAFTIPASRMIDKAKKDYKAFHATEEEYQRRLAVRTKLVHRPEWRWVLLAPLPDRQPLFWRSPRQSAAPRFPSIARLRRHHLFTVAPGWILAIVAASRLLSGVGVWQARPRTNPSRSPTLEHGPTPRLLPDERCHRSGAPG